LKHSWSAGVGLQAANPVPWFLDLLLGGTICFFRRRGGKKCKEEKWHLLAVVLHACVDVPGGHVRSKASYLKQQHSAGNYSYCASPGDWLIS